MTQLPETLGGIKSALASGAIVESELVDIMAEMDALVIDGEKMEHGDTVPFAYGSLTGLTEYAGPDAVVGCVGAETGPNGGGGIMRYLAPVRDDDRRPSRTVECSRCCRPLVHRVPLTVKGRTYCPLIRVSRNAVARAVKLGL